MMSIYVFALVPILLSPVCFLSISYNKPLKKYSKIALTPWLAISWGGDLSVLLITRNSMRFVSSMISGGRELE